ncbi:2'-5' RNA ligase family protein [Alteraurantiacibacter aquimixticola]|uniref:2'-5' RNA ligase family protein n=1 Tax=Alteraurantiacibacter aquimixticola TaxID=2489173 RepID=A0A4T3F4E8_9SPHN|nr:2'-5' RNA ligase family protein [Alteraurantiacibacter aquimixticola]TIX52163.1 2'-5' RNA ligase family protein [Alteraurantiacibacter aquimixticola]
MGNDPLIVTAELPQDLYSWANQLRTEHFPPERNVLKAHVTLFHALPPSAEGEVRDCLARLAAENPPVPARLEGVMKLGKGTGLQISSPGMIALWEEMADRFHGMLTPQDEHRPRLHITVQNKVSIEEAKALQADLSLRVEPRDFAFRGLELHAYKGGPWEFLQRWRFRG